MTSAPGDAGQLQGSPAVTISVVAYASRYQTLVRVPAQLPTGTLLDQLGGPVGVAQVSSLQLPDGTTISPQSTLEEIGVGDGGSIEVLSVYDTATGVVGTSTPGPWSAGELRSQLSRWLTDRDDAGPPPEIPANPARPAADDPMWGVVPLARESPPEQATAALPAPSYFWEPEQSDPGGPAGPAGGSTETEPPEWAGEPAGSAAGFTETEPREWASEPADRAAESPAPPVERPLPDYPTPEARESANADELTPEAQGSTTTGEQAPEPQPVIAADGPTPAVRQSSDEESPEAWQSTNDQPTPEAQSFIDPPHPSPAAGQSGELTPLTSTVVGLPPPVGSAYPDAPSPPTAVETGRRPALAHGRAPGTVRRRRGVVGVGAVAVAVALAGGVLIGRVTSSSPANPDPAVLSAARQDANRWMAAAGYPTPAVVAGASPSTGRTGRVNGTANLVGSTKRGNDTDVWFIVGFPHKGPVGLTVRLSGSKLVGPPTVSPLPFGEGTVPPHAPGSPATPSTTPPVITRWARATFGQKGQLTATLGAGLVGHPQVVNASSTGSGAVVYRVRLDLSSRAPGTPARQANASLARERTRVKALQSTVNATRSQVNSAVAAVNRDTAAVTTDGTAIVNGSNVVNQANAANVAANKALAQAKTASGGASAPPSPSVAAAQAAATKAGQALTAAQTQLAKVRSELSVTQAQQKSDQTILVTDQAKLSAGRSSLTTAKAARTAARARIPAPVTAVGTYDVWVSSDQIKGWVPAGFDGV